MGVYVFEMIWSQFARLLRGRSFGFIAGQESSYRLRAERLAEPHHDLSRNE